MKRADSTTLGVFTGTVVAWKGSFGFIRPDERGKDVFVYFTAIDSQMTHRQLNQGQRVEYELVHGVKGAEAAHVKVVGA